MNYESVGAKGNSTEADGLSTEGGLADIEGDGGLNGKSVEDGLDGADGGGSERQFVDFCAPDNEGVESECEGAEFEDEQCVLSTSEEEDADFKIEENIESDSLDSLDIEGETDDDCDVFSDVDMDGEGIQRNGEDPELECQLIQVNRINAGVWFKRSPDGKIELKQGQLFNDVNHFREVIKEYIIQEGFEVVRQKNEKSRVTMVCKGDGCPWRIHASHTQDGHTYKIKTYNPEHTCLRKSSFRDASYFWIAEKLIDKFAAEPCKSRKGIETDLRDMFGITGLKPCKIFRARQKAKCLIYGDHFEQYAKTRAYGELVLHHNPGSLFYVSTYERSSIEQPLMFKRLFVVFDGVRNGFLNGCRPFIGVDGCFLKGEYGGMFLAAVALDGNNGILPLAACVAETENRDTWLYFFNLLKDAIGESYGLSPWTFISDRQKGLIDAAQEVFPNVIQRYCLFHIEANFKLKFRSGDLKDKMWEAGKACNARRFNLYMQQIKEENENAAKWLQNIPTHLWSRHAMNPVSRVDHISNNVSESLNSWINDNRDLPILSLMEGYRNKVMKRLASRYARATSFKGKLVPNTTKRINAEWAVARKFEVFESGQSKFQVKVGSVVHIVDLRNWSCDCGRWAISGIPCMHGIACIRVSNKEIEDFVHSAFSVETYFKVYENIINPQPDLGVLEMPTENIVHPPPLRRRRGRPRKMRRVQPSEKLGLQRSTVLRCTMCKEIGHNRRSCQRIGPQESQRESTSQRARATTSSMGRH